MRYTRWDLYYLELPIELRINGCLIFHKNQHHGAVLLKRNVQQSKKEPLVDQAELLQANPQYAQIRYPDGRESTVSIRHLAPMGEEISSSSSS